MTAGYSGTPLARKLGVEPGMRVLAVRAPSGFEELLAPLPEGAVVGNRYRTADLAVVFARSEGDMRTGIERALGALPRDGAVWLCWQKKASGIISPLQDRSVVTSHLFPLGLVDVKVAAIDETWSGLKFVIRTALR